MVHCSVSLFKITEHVHCVLVSGELSSYVGLKSSLSSALCLDVDVSCSSLCDTKASTLSLSRTALDVRQTAHKTTQHNTKSAQTWRNESARPRLQHRQSEQHFLHLVLRMMLFNISLCGQCTV